MLSYDPHVAVISETWLHPQIPDNCIFPPSYTCYRKDRQTRGGGVAILVKREVSSVSLPDINSCHESVFCKAVIAGNPIIIAGVYRPPGAPPAFLIDLYEHLEKYRNQNIIIAGDFNMPGMHWESMKCGSIDVQSAEILLDMSLAYSLTQTVLDPTRVTSSASSILDLVFCSASFESCMATVLDGISDHKLVNFNCSLPRRTRSSRPEPVVVKQYSAADDFQIVHYLEEALLSFCDGSVNSLWTRFKFYCHFCIRNFVPDKLKKVGRTNPWITRDLIHLKRKIKRRRKQKIANDVVLHDLRDTLASKLKEAREHYYTETLGRFASESPRKFYQFLQNKDNRIPDEIMNGETAVTNKNEIANAFNSYFQSVFSRPQNLSIMTVPGPSSLINISLEGVTELLLRLDVKKSTGPDGIPAVFLKRYAEIIARFLVIIFDVSIKTSSVPDDWLLARVIPVFKKGNRLLVSNYRPISLTCICCKLLEHIIAKYLNTFLEQNKVIHSAQHGFRRGLSTTTQLLATVNEFSKVLDKSGQVDVIFMDFSKAFDKVPHIKLIDKMKVIGIPPEIINWVIAYLTNRKQYVDINGFTSGYLGVLSGVPQGSVLGPILFNIYINDLVQAIRPGVSVKLFADDCIIFNTINSISDQRDLCENLNYIKEWCKKWEMVINFEKTAYLCLSNKIRKLEFTYNVGGYAIRQVEEFKYLGVTITSKLSWTAHIDGICSAARRKLGFLKYKLGRSSSSLKLRAYKVIVRPSLEYASIVWDPHTAGNIQKIEKIQRLAARFIYNRYRCRDSPSALLQDANLQLLADRRKTARLNFFRLLYFSRSGLHAPDYITQDTTRSSRHKHSRSITPIFARTNIYKYSFFPRTVSDWNALPHDSPMLDTPR